MHSRDNMHKTISYCTTRVAARLLAEEEEEGFYKAHNDIHVDTTYVSYLCRPMHPSDNHMALMLLSSTSQGQGCPAGAGKG